MKTENTPSKKMLWIGWIISALCIIFLLMDGIMKLIKPDFVVVATIQLGYPANTIFGIGMTLTICTVLYAIPKTSVIGAILLTGYLGGAVATNVRVESPLFSHVLFPIYIGTLLWVGLLIREKRLKAFLPWT